ncbi:hypothetical protein ACMFMG_011919 [Clarireedia jacksonii]
MEIKPVRLELPIVNKEEFLNLVGKYSRGGNKGVAGVYIFTNKSNGYSYVGSSISLANRLSTGYFKPTLGKRKIDLAITSLGLDSFHLDLYILPSDLFQNSANVVDKSKTSLFFSKTKQLTLALEQIFLLVYNPEYNILKVAVKKRKKKTIVNFCLLLFLFLFFFFFFFTPAGIKRTPESMINNFIVNSKPLFMYDTVNQELIYKASSQNKFGIVLGINASNLRPFFTNGQLYLGRFLLSYTSINNQEYKSNLLDEQKLLELIKDVAKKHRVSLAIENLNKTRSSNKLKASRQVKLTNLDTKEVLFLIQDKIQQSI